MLVCFHLIIYMHHGSLLLSNSIDSSDNTSFDSVIHIIHITQPCYLSKWQIVKSKENGLNNLYTTGFLQVVARFQENSHLLISCHCYSVAMEVSMSTKHSLKLSLILFHFGAFS